jgi:translation initiation factor 2B subunit (eIF-2B alpha/beta/delta family)
MGKIAEALRSNLQSIAQSDARTLRRFDQELRSATEVVGTEKPAALSGLDEAKALLGMGSFDQQTVAALKSLCRKHGLKGYSKLKKADLAVLLSSNGVQPPPRPLESFSKKELVSLIRQILGAS